MKFEIDAIDRTDNQPIAAGVDASNLHAAALLAASNNWNVVRIRLIRGDEPAPSPVFAAAVPLRDGVLDYGTEATDALWRRESYDREMLIRLSRALGIGYFLVGGIVLLMASYDVYRRGQWGDLIAILMAYLFPGIAFGACSMFVATSRVGSMVALLVVGIWTFLCTFILLGYIMEFMLRRAFNLEELAFPLANCLVLIPVGHVLFRAGRILAHGDLRGGTIVRLVGVTRYFELDWLGGNLPDVLRVLAAAGIAGNLIGLAVGIRHPLLPARAALAVVSLAGLALWILLLFKSAANMSALRRLARLKILHAPVAFAALYWLASTGFTSTSPQSIRAMNVFMNLAIVAGVGLVGFIFPLRLLKLASRQTAGFAAPANLL